MPAAISESVGFTPRSLATDDTTQVSLRTMQRIRTASSLDIRMEALVHSYALDMIAMNTLVITRVVLSKNVK